MIIQLFIQIRHTDDFPSTGIPASNNILNTNRIISCYVPCPHVEYVLAELKFCKIKKTG